MLPACLPAKVNIEDNKEFLRLTLTHINRLFAARICPGCEMTSSSQQSGTVDMISDENFYNELGAGDMGIDCGDFDDCSAFTADAFASM